MTRLRNATVVLFFSIALVFILFMGKGLIVPIVWAILLWYLLRGVKNGLDKIPGVGKILPGWVKTTISVLIFGVVYLFIVNLVVDNIQHLIKKMPEFSSNLKVVRTWIDSSYLEYIQLDNPEQLIGEYLTPFLEDLSQSLSSFLSALFMVIIYVIFISSEAVNFREKMNNIFPKEDERTTYLNVLNEIDGSISNYLWLKTIVSLTTGVISFIILYSIGAEAASFWAFVIFLLNYIPSIGSLIATVFPTLMALIQFGDWVEPLLVLSLVGATQMIIGNYVEPKIMGRSLNLSAFVVIVALSFWTVIWGLTGAILSVPITVVLVILFKQFDSTRTLARALTEKGNI